MKICKNNCSECMINQKEYKETLQNKQELINSLFKNDLDKIEAIVGCKDDQNYRHKVIATFGYNKKKKVISGIYKQGTHNLIPLTDCNIQSDKANMILKSINQLANKFKVPVYDEDRRTGILRHVLVRVSEYTDEILVCLVIGTSKFPSRKNFVKQIVKKHPEITTVTTSVNNRKTSVVLGDKTEVIYGPGFIYDSLNSYRFRISSKSFYQINPKQTEILYSLAIDNADLKETDVLLDTYSGIGTIGMIASEKVKKVISVELNKESYKNAINNVRVNSISNIELVNKDATEYMILAAEKATAIDVVIMDPTRNGSTPEFMEALLKLKPRRIVYISCNPETQVRDLRYIKKEYKIKKIIPVDMFPYTNHLEDIVILTVK